MFQALDDTFFHMVHFLHKLSHYLISHHHHALSHPGSLDKGIHTLRTAFGFFLSPQHLLCLNSLFAWIPLPLQDSAWAQICLSFPGLCFFSIQYFLYHALSQSIALDCNRFSSLKHKLNEDRGHISFHCNGCIRQLLAHMSRIPPKCWLKEQINELLSELSNIRFSDKKNEAQRDLVVTL